jgi:hypothetical protein
MRPTTLYRQHQSQGNRIVRAIDYRTQLLSRSKKKWGLCSRDGQCVTSAQFNRQLAIYHSEFASSQLCAGNLITSIRAFLKAWLANPSHIKYLGYVPAAIFGWKPKW